MKILQTWSLKQGIFQSFRTKTPTDLLYWNFNLDVGMDFPNMDKQ